MFIFHGEPVITTRGYWNIKHVQEFRREYVFHSTIEVCRIKKGDIIHECIEKNMDVYVAQTEALFVGLVVYN